MIDPPRRTVTTTLNRYTALMKEVKIRISSLEAALNGKTGLPDFLVQEYCFLQLRMVCELIAIGCLVAHGDQLPATSGMRNVYEADAIIRGLEALLPDFYPLPVTETMEPGGIVHIKPDRDADFITKKELTGLYGRCGRYLHRGTRQSLFGPTPRRRTVDFAVIAKHAQRIYNLLGMHSMVLADNRTYFFCSLKTAPDGRVRTWIAK